MDRTTKSLLSALLTEVHSQREQIGRLQVSLEAAIAAMRGANPLLGTSYDDELLSPDRDETKHLTEHLLALIHTAIQTLEATEPQL